MSRSTDRLVAALTHRMQQTSRAGQPMGLDLGQITDRKLTLTTDRIRSPIPRGSYSTLGPLSLEAGDRVVVAWVGNEPIVLGRLVST